jgi:hypothetical protein
MPHFNEPVVIDIEPCTPTRADDAVFVERTERFRARRPSILLGLIQAGQRFGAAHPSLVAIIGKLADGLSQLGI